MLYFSVLLTQNYFGYEMSASNFFVNGNELLIDYSFVV